MSLSLSLTPLTVKIPEDILMEILARLPADSVTRFKCVSKLWYSLISSRYFTNLFVKFSTKLERRVFVYVVNYLDDYSMLFSSRRSNLDATTSFVQQLNRDLTLPCLKKDSWKFLNAIRGLMCFRVSIDTVEEYPHIRIINFTTRQVLSLPLVEYNLDLESAEYYEWNYFGYDPVNDQYKVLSTLSTTENTNELRSETQVFVLGEGASWRNTKSLTFSPPPHDPDFGGISINGVLYNLVRSQDERSVLMIFDFNSEEFNLIKLPLVNLRRCIHIKLLNYRDQIAVFDDSRVFSTECILDLWVLEDAGKSKWSHKFFVLPCHQIRETLELEDTDALIIRGTGRSGELSLFGGTKLNKNNKSAHAFYHLKKNRITRVVGFEPPHSNHPFVVLMNLWDDVESIMYLEP